MLETLKYVNNMGIVFEFGKNGVYANENDLRNYSWAFDSDKSRIENFRKTVTSKKLPVVITAKSKEEGVALKNRMFEVFEQDIICGMPGQLWINDYFMKCFITESSKENYLKDKEILNVSLKISSDTGNWFCESLTRFRFTDDRKKEVPGKGYPYGYYYDYAAGVGHASLLKNEVFDSTEFVLIIYGYAQNPSITIGGNVYSLNCTIQEGDRLIIHSQEKTVTLIRSNDIRENYFRYRESGKNIFEKLPAGSDIPVYWNADFDFDLWTIEERSEPLWT